MNIRKVCAVLNLKTPHGNLRKVVNWSHYEMKATLTPSVTSFGAYSRFFRDGKTIIGSSGRELMYLDSIMFYEEDRDENRLFYSKKNNRTRTIKIVRDDDEIMKFETMP